jgi:hypothetical protein
MIILKIIYFATIAFSWTGFFHRCIHVHNIGRKFSLKLLGAVALMFIISLIPPFNISVSSTLFNDNLCDNMLRTIEKENLGTLE